MRVYNALGNGQAYAGSPGVAVARLVGAVEAPENVGQFLFLYAYAAIGYMNQVFCPLLFQGNVNLPPVSISDGVGQNIYKHLPQAVLVRAHGGFGGIELEFQALAFGKRQILACDVGKQV